jgi:hypothetical protein
MPRNRQRQQPTLERKIYFYRMHVGTDEAGSPVTFDPRPVLRTIDTLPFVGSQERYLVDDESNAVCAWVDDIGAEPKIRLVRVRRTGLPQIEEAGLLSDLNLAVNAGLAEPVHVIFFPNNIVGADFNYHGPRLSRLAFYLHYKGGDGVPLVNFEPLLRLDVSAQLNRLRDVRLFNLKVRPSYASAVREADQDLGSAFQAAQHLGDTEEVQILIKPNRQGQRSLLERFTGLARQLIRRADLRTEASKFVINGKCQDSGRVEPIDLLRDHLIAHRQIISLGERSRAPNPESAYQAIQSAYNDLHTELENAASIKS